MFDYLKQLMKDRSVASVTPTAANVVHYVCQQIDAHQRQVVIEYGPGTGVFTEGLLQRLSANSTLIVIEQNQQFVDLLHQKFNDSRLHIYQGSAEHVNQFITKQQIKEADYILSGIPFSMIPANARKQIIAETYETLIINGKFITYQTIYQKRKYLFAHLLNHFAHVQTSYHMRNFPPLKIHISTKE